MSLEKRLRLIADLRSATNCRTHATLMDALQDRGLISDECVNIDEVPDADLLSALVRIQKQTVAK